MRYVRRNKDDERFLVGTSASQKKMKRHLSSNKEIKRTGNDKHLSKNKSFFLIISIYLKEEWQFKTQCIVVLIIYIEIKYITIAPRPREEKGSILW